MIFSVALQHGVPLQSVCEKLAHTRFEPSGWTGNEKMGYAKSIMNYLGRWMQHRYLEGTTRPLRVTGARSFIRDAVSCLYRFWGRCHHSTLRRFTDVWRVRLVNAAVRFVLSL